MCRGGYVRRFTAPWGNIGGKPPAGVAHIFFFIRERLNPLFPCTYSRVNAPRDERGNGQLCADYVRAAILFSIRDRFIRTRNRPFPLWRVSALFLFVFWCIYFDFVRRECEWFADSTLDAASAPPVDRFANKLSEWFVYWINSFYRRTIFLIWDIIELIIFECAMNQYINPDFFFFILFFLPIIPYRSIRCVLSHEKQISLFFYL